MAFFVCISLLLDSRSSSDIPDEVPGDAFQALLPAGCSSTPEHPGILPVNADEHVITLGTPSAPVTESLPASTPEAPSALVPRTDPAFPSGPVFLLEALATASNTSTPAHGVVSFFYCSSF